MFCYKNARHMVKRSSLQIFYLQALIFEKKGKKK